MIRKVAVFKEEYRLKEKGAILNWFDISAPDGFYSLSDKLSDIMKSPAGAQLFGQMMQQMVAGAGKNSMMGDFKIESSGLMQMMGGFTVIRLTSLMGAAGVSMTKEQLLGLNAMLNRIPKM